MKIDKVYSWLNYLRRKDPIGGSISVPEFNQNCLIAAFKFFKKVMGLPEQYQKGARDPVVGYGLNEPSEERIRPLKVLPVEIDIDSNGYASYPNDYFRKSTCNCMYSEPGQPDRNVDIPFVNDSKFIERHSTVLDPPTKSDPVGNLHKDVIRFLPRDLAKAYLGYIKYPTEPVMGYVMDIETAENIYVNKGAYCQVLTPGVAGNVITLSVGLVTLGTYTVLAGDTSEDVMEALRDAINVDTLGHNVKAVYDGVKIVLIDLGETYTTLTSYVTGGITINKTNFTQWSTQFDWEDDVDAMTEISEMILDQMGISNRDIPIVQYAEKEMTK